MDGELEAYSPRSASGADRLRSALPRILDAWEDRVRKELPYAEFHDAPTLRNTLPVFLEKLAASLESSKTNKGSCRHSAVCVEHGKERASLHACTAHQILLEYKILKAIVIEFLGSSSALTPDEMEHIHSSFEDAALLAVREFDRLQHQASASIQAELSAALKHRDEILSVASHELKTPLAGLLLQLQLLERHIKKCVNVQRLTETLSRSLPTALGQARRLSGMLDRLLDLTRIRNKRLSLEISVIDLCTLLHEIMKQLEPQARQAGSDVRFESCGETFAYVDAVRIEQVLTNLTTNAIKYGAGNPIHVRLNATDEEAIISVKDRGIGIPPEAQARIFDRFERATETKRMESLGLGLYITHQIVLAHGGKIELQSTPGQGSEFMVKLPRKQLPVNSVSETEKK